MVQTELSKKLLNSVKKFGGVKKISYLCTTKQLKTNGFKILLDMGTIRY